MMLLIAIVMFFLLDIDGSMYVYYNCLGVTMDRSKALFSDISVRYK